MKKHKYKIKTIIYMILIDTVKRFGYALTMLGISGLFCWLQAQPLNINYGVNWLDINADGINDMIVRTRWENMNAHSFDRFLIALVLEGEGYSGAKYYEVPLGDSYDYRIETREGAECLRVGYKFSLNAQNMLEITKYSLEESENIYCGKTLMSVTKYGLQPSPEGEVGVPYFYLKNFGVKRALNKRESVEDLIR